MAAFIFDLDGTLVSFETHEPLPGAVETVNRLYDEGHRIIFTTRRGDLEFAGHAYYSRQATYSMLRLNEFKYHDIIFDVPSPRIVINDAGAYAVNVERNADVDYDKIAEALGE